jgi:uncharacterized membrane protein
VVWRTLNKHLESILNARFSIRVGQKKVIFYVFCHRIPERCFTFGRLRMPICSRCFGIVIGAISGFILRSIIYLTYETLLSLSILFCIPLVIDGFTQLFGYRVSNNNLRFVTGILCGVSVVFFAKLVVAIIS